MNEHSFRPLILITDGGASRQSGTLTSKVVAALEGADNFVEAVVLREQIDSSFYEPASDQEVLELVRVLQPICHSAGAKLVVHNRADLAKKAGADGVHLNKNSIPMLEARRILGQETLVGYSAHTSGELVDPHLQLSSYFFYSPIFSPISKHSQVSPLGVKELGSAVKSSTRPIYALGGVSPGNARQCRDAGAAGVAVISWGIGSADPKSAASKLLEGWQGE